MQRKETADSTIKEQTKQTLDEGIHSHEDTIDGITQEQRRYLRSLMPPSFLQDIDVNSIAPDLS